MSYQQKQLTHSVVMVRPHDFGFNEQTGADNEFQHRPTSDNSAIDISNKAMDEFEQMVRLLGKSGLEVLVLDKPDTTSTLPDAIFPNNWFSTREDGQLIIYPMKTQNRRDEVQPKELQLLLAEYHYSIKEIVDLQHLKPMEGTGSLIFHHPTATVFAALSERCDKDALDSFTDQFSYDAFSFSTASHLGQAIYHSNVLMSCGNDFAENVPYKLNNIFPII